jgi:hypothetical protein
VADTVWLSCPSDTVKRRQYVPFASGASVFDNQSKETILAPFDRIGRT